MSTPTEENKPPVPKEEKSKASILGGVVELFKSSVGDTIAYAILALSLVYSFFEPFLGTLPVGFILGLYFSTYAFYLAKQFKDFLVKEGIFRGFILIASVAALFISAPGLSIGVIVGAFARPLFGKEEGPESK
jgi:hypothetical protein